LIYVDTSVALAQLLAEDRQPPASLWQETLVASRLLEYEIWTRLHARKVADSHGEAARNLVGRIALLELAAPILARAMDPFPHPIRTLDALHLASLQYLIEQQQEVWMASYDRGMLTVAQSMQLPILDL